MDFAVYSRKSKMTNKGDSVENQVEMCKTYIKANYTDIGNVYVYEDEGFSGKNTRRPQFLQMMEDAKSKLFSCVVVYRLDRISRNIVDFIAITDKLSSKNIGFVSINERFDTSSPMGRAMMQIAAVFAQLERETIAERVSDNMLMLSKSGRWLGGRTPLGFSSQRVKVDREAGITKEYSYLVPNEDMALVEKIFSLYEELGSFHAVQRKIFLDKLASDKNHKVNDMFVKKILENPVYCVADKVAYNYFTMLLSSVADEAAFDGVHGIMPYNRHQEAGKGSTVKEEKDWVIAVGKHKGVISGERWVAIQERIATNRTRYDNFSSATNNYALLSGKLICAKCGKRMYTKPQNKTGRKGSANTFFYVCDTQRKYGSVACSCKAVLGDKIDNAFVEALASYEDATANDTALKAQIDALVAEKQNAKKSTSEIRRLESLLKEKNDKVGGMFQYLGTVQTDADTQPIRDSITSMLAEISQLKEQIEAEKAKEQTLKEKAKIGEDFKKELLNFKGALRQAPIPVQRDWIRKFVDRVEWDGESLHVFLRGA